jgi:hypothetical protein
VIIDSTRRVAPYPRNDTTRRYGGGMDPTQLLAFLKDQLQQAGHPEITAVEDLDNPGLKIECADGSRLFPRICYAGRDPQPTKPSWPARDDLSRMGARR